MIRTLIEYLIITTLGGLLLGCSFSEKKSSNQTEEHSNIEVVIPDWLKLNVDEALPSQGLNVWIPTNSLASSSLVRVPKYPRVFSKVEITNNSALTDFEILPISDSTSLTLSAVKNEQISFQVALAHRKKFTLTGARIETLSKKDGAVLDSENIQVRYVKYLPVQRARSEYVWSPKLEKIVGEGVSGNMNPNVVGDPLIKMDTLAIEAYSVQPIWFTIKILKNTSVGNYQGNIKLNTEQHGEITIPIDLEVTDIELPDSENYNFNLDLWINPSAIAEHYKLDHWSKDHWKLIKTYLEDYADKGGKNIATTITHEPWHKPWLGNSTRSQIEFGYRSMVTWELTKENGWKFNYSVFDTYVELAKELGISGAINAYSLTPFHSKQKILYNDQNTGIEKILEIDITDSKYKEIWTIFLKDFKKHLTQKGWFERTYLGFDEKPESILQVIKEVIKGAAPEFLDRIVIAGHPETTSLAQNLSISYMFFPGQDLEQKAVVPVIPTISERTKAGKQTTFYLCAEPAHPNTLTISPAIEAQLIPWLALKYKTDGYLRWAYNNWTSDTFKKPVFLHTQGDDYYVYPGEKGPISSIRWELLKEGIEDYELFTLRKENGEIPESNLEKAIEMATRSQDGRYKKSSDIIEARHLLSKVQKP